MTSLFKGSRVTKKSLSSQVSWATQVHTARSCFLPSRGAAGVWIGIGKIQSQPTVTVKSVNTKKEEWMGWPFHPTPYKRPQKLVCAFFPPSDTKSIRGAQVWGETRLRVHLSSLIHGFLCDQVSTLWTWYQQVPAASVVQKTCQWAFLGSGSHHRESLRVRVSWEILLMLDGWKYGKLCVVLCGKYFSKYSYMQVKTHETNVNNCKCVL